MSIDHYDIEPLRILPQTRNLEHVRTFIDGAMGATNLTSVERNGIVLAVDEACANLIAHAVSAQPREEIEVWVRVTHFEIEIEIRDRSMAFDPRSVEPPDMAAYFREMRSGGLGIALIRRVMDQIEYIPATMEAPYNRLILRKRHRSAS